MSYIDKALSLMAMGGTVMGSSAASVSLLQKFLSTVRTVIVLTALSAALAGILFVGGLYGGYMLLITYGLHPLAAFIAVGLVALGAVLTLACLTMVRWRELREMPHQMRLETPVIGQATRIADAFIDGLRGSRREHRR